jgi:hypothetical protein
MESGMDFSGQSTFFEDGTSEDFEYSSYMEGVYHMDVDYFWNIVHDEIDYNKEQGLKINEFIGRFHFLPKKDIKQIKEIYVSE